MFIILGVIIAIVFVVWFAKKGAFNTKRNSQLALRDGEVSILATEIVWFNKKFYPHKNLIPRGVLDITNQRVVYTREYGEKGEFALEKSDIDCVIHAKGMRVNLKAKDGTIYSFNTNPAKDTLEGFKKMGVPVEE